MNTLLASYVPTGPLITTAHIYPKALCNSYFLKLFCSMMRLILIALLAIVAYAEDHAMTGSVSNSKLDAGDQNFRAIAEDAITISILEFTNAQKLIALIPQLESLQASNDASFQDELHSCVEGLASATSSALDTLHCMQELNSATVLNGTNVNSLYVSMTNLVNFNNLCSYALNKDDDATIDTIVDRSVKNLVMLTNDVLYAVSRFVQQSQ